MSQEYRAHALDPRVDAAFPLYVRPQPSAPCSAIYSCRLQASFGPRPTRCREEHPDADGVITSLHHAACARQQLEEPAAQQGNRERYFFISISNNGALTYLPTYLMISYLPN